MKFIRLFNLFLVSVSLGQTSISAASATYPDTAFQSQASQDQFVYTLLYDILNKQDEGYYLDIGASHPVRISNSYFFDRNLSWNGIGIDISDEYASEWAKQRKNALLIADATRVDYAEILKPFPPVIDYLSLDVDEKYDAVLEVIPFDQYIFKIITIEHDAYRYGDVYRNAERKILSSHGYYLLCPNVSKLGYVYEDWWIHPSAFPSDVLDELKMMDLQDKDYQQLILNIQSIIPNN